MKLRRNHLCPIRRLRAMPTCLASTILSASTGVVIVTVTISCLKGGTPSLGISVKSSLKNFHKVFAAFLRVHLVCIGE